MGFFSNLWAQLKPLVEKILGPFGKVIDLVERLWNGVTNSVAKINSLYQSIVDEIEAWRNFKQSLAFRTRVISINKAIDQGGALLAGIPASWRAIVDLVSQLRSKFAGIGSGNPAEDARAALKDIEDSPFKNILTKWPKFAKGLEKLLGWVALIADALDSILAAVDDLQTIVNETKAIREAVETGETIFLSQKNTRRTVTLEDGTKMKIRVGNLHS